jgi:predicted nucleic acid-binding protein
VSYLLDTNVVSELRKPARRAARPVREWAARQVTHELSISVVTVVEIEIGVTRMERRDTDQGRILRAWFERPTAASAGGPQKAVA